MGAHRDPIPEDRDLTSAERVLVTWLLEHGIREAQPFLAQVPGLRVVSRCQCGCASINFGPAHAAPMQVLSEYMYEQPSGGLTGVFVFAQSGRLAGLDVWSIDGRGSNNSLPDPSTLRPLE